MSNAETLGQAIIWYIFMINICTQHGRSFPHLKTTFKINFLEKGSGPLHCESVRQQPEEQTQLNKHYFILNILVLFSAHNKSFAFKAAALATTGWKSYIFRKQIKIWQQHEKVNKSFELNKITSWHTHTYTYICTCCKYIPIHIMIWSANSISPAQELTAVTQISKFYQNT